MSIMPPSALSYIGQVAVPYIVKNFDPSSDYLNFPVPTLWVNFSSKQAWILCAVDLGSAEWVKVGGIEGAVESIGVDTSTPPGTDPVLPNGSYVIEITGGQVAAGTTANAIQTASLSANTITVQIQRSTATASSTVGSNGVSHYNSAQFSSDANAFIQLVDPPVNASSRFNAYLSATVPNVTGDGTNYTLIFDTESFDANSDYDNTTGKFTAPEDGVYWFECCLYATNIGAAHTSGNAQILVTELAGGALRGVISNIFSPAAVKDNSNSCQFQASSIISLLAGDTVECLMQVTSSTKTVSAFGGLTGFNEQQSYFSGFRIR